MTQARREFTAFLGFTCCLSMLVAVSSTAIAGDRLQAARPAARAKPSAGQHEIQLETRLPSGELTTRLANSSVIGRVTDASSSASGGNCEACNDGFFDDAQIGIQGDYVQECQDGGWISTAFPILALAFNTVRVQLNSNRVGGDIYIMRNVPGDCQPDTTQILVTMCCALEGLDPRVPQELHFPLTIGSPEEPTWVVFVGRTGLARQDEEGVFTGGVFPGTRVARDPSSGTAPGRAFFNLVGTGKPR